MKDFNWELIYRGKGAVPEPETDRGPVMMPKLFRRLCVWAVNSKAGMITGNFQKYLVTTKDEFHLTDDFLEQGVAAAEIHTLDEFINQNGKFALAPDEMVFREKPSRLLGPDGQPVNW
jgi:hypothetical protein